MPPFFNMGQIVIMIAISGVKNCLDKTRGQGQKEKTYGGYEYRRNYLGVIFLFRSLEIIIFSQNLSFFLFWGAKTSNHVPFLFF